MIDFEKHFLELQNAIGVKNLTTGKNSADEIDDDTWYKEVMRRLDKASSECADELEEEIGKKYGKYATDGVKVWKAYDLDYKKAPLTRLLSQALILSYWLGYHDEDKGHYLHEEEIAAWRRINDAYKKGKNAYIEYRKKEDANSKGAS